MTPVAPEPPKVVTRTRREVANGNSAIRSSLVAMLFFCLTDIGAMQRLIDERMVSMPRNATPEQQYLAFQLIPPTREFVSILAARGLPPDWTEEELERQGYDLWATRPEDIYTGPPPVPDPWRGDGRGVAAAMRAQLESAFREEDES